MNITPTQFKELLLEEVGNCTEPQHVIFSIVKDMEPNDVAELFQDVFEQLPGVDMTRVDPEAEEEPIPTSYQPGGELGDRPVVGFKEQLMEMVRQELREITYMDRLKKGDTSAHGRNVAASQRRAAERKADYEAGYAHAQEGGKCIADKDTTWGVGVPCTGKSSWEEGFLAGREGL